MWRKSAVALAPNLRVAAAVAVALQATVTFQAMAALALALALILCQMTAREVSPSSDINPTKQRWVLEMTRAKPKTKGKDNKVVGFRSFYKQHFFNYSKKEFLAAQGH
eukprot:1292350-Ditylum_brightwellii.AAC.1